MMKKPIFVFLFPLLLSLGLLCGCGEATVVEPTPTPHVHTWSPANCVRPATCTLCGETQGSALGHTWVAATAERPRHCSVCGETEGTVLSPSPAPTNSARPGAHDLKDIGSPITYPTSYLSEYKTMTVIAEHKICVYIYYSAKATKDNRLPYDLPHLTEVTVIAEKNGLSCVIYRDADGYVRSGWVTSSHLVKSEAPAETKESPLQGDPYSFAVAENRWYLSQPLSGQSLEFFPVDVDGNGIDELVVLKRGGPMDSGFYWVYGAFPSENRVALITSGNCSADAFVQVNEGTHTLAVSEYHTGYEYDILLRIQDGVLTGSECVELDPEAGEGLPGYFRPVEAVPLQGTGSHGGQSSPDRRPTAVELFTENSTYSKRNSVAVAHSQKLSSCETCVKRLRENGYNAFLYEETNKSGYTILIGVFGTAQEAKDFAEYLHTQPEVKGVALDHAYAVSKIRLSDSVASRYGSPWW